MTTGTPPAKSPNVTYTTRTPSDAEILKTPNKKEKRQPNLDALPEEQRKQVEDANKAGKPIAVTTTTKGDDGKTTSSTYIYVPEGYKPKAPAKAKRKGSTAKKTATPTTNKADVDQALAAQPVEAQQPAAEPEKKEGSWWERNKSWMGWVLGGLGVAAVATVAILGFRKGGWWNKKKSSTATASTSTSTGTSTGTTTNTNQGTAYEGTTLGALLGTTTNTTTTTQTTTTTTTPTTNTTLANNSTQVNTNNTGTNTNQGTAFNGSTLGDWFTR